MTPSQQQAMQVVQAQQAAQQAQQQPQQGVANGGLGSPPQPFDYQPNPSIDLMKAHVANQQQALAAQAAQQNQQQGYAGYQSDNTAGIVNANPQSDPNAQQPAQANNAPHPNTGWVPNSQEAHQLNIQIADRIKTGTLDPKTAMLAVQSPDVSPEVKQALVSIIQQAQQAQQGGQIGQGMPQPQQGGQQQPQGGPGLNPAGPVGQ